MFFRNILIIVQRSNGDVLLSGPLIQQLSENYPNCNIDLLVNDDTEAIARCLNNVRDIITFSYKRKKECRYQQEKEIIGKIYRKYDLSISLTSSDRSSIYAILASKFSIGPVDGNFLKFWWKKILLKRFYFWNSGKHILLNNFSSLELLNLKSNHKIGKTIFNESIPLKRIKTILNENNVKKFIIFHPSAQYSYKVYPKKLRLSLLEKLSALDITIIITGGTSTIDNEISKTIPNYDNVLNLIGKTSVSEYIALSQLSIGYIGMDTLNMHIAAVQKKKVLCIMGPTDLRVWAPWSNEGLPKNMGKKSDLKYGKISIFQAEMNCVPCGKAGCNDNGKTSECLNNIDPDNIFIEAKKLTSNFK